MGIPMCFPRFAPTYPPADTPLINTLWILPKDITELKMRTLRLGHPFPKFQRARYRCLRFLKTLIISSSAIIRISSEPVEISSEPVEISSELVEISSELVSTILELLIISVFRKRPNRFHTRSFRLAMKLKANPFISPLFTCLLNPLCAPEAAKCFPFQSD